MSISSKRIVAGTRKRVISTTALFVGKVVLDIWKCTTL